MSARATIREFISRNFYVPEPDSLQDGDSLLDQGIIDSTGVMELIEFVQRTFGVQFADSDMVPANLDSVERIVGFIERKRVHAA